MDATMRLTDGLKQEKKLEANQQSEWPARRSPQANNTKWKGQAVTRCSIGIMYWSYGPGQQCSRVSPQYCQCSTGTNQCECCQGRRDGAGSTAVFCVFRAWTILLSFQRCCYLRTEKEAPQNWEEHRPKSCDDIYHIIGLRISQRHLDGQQVLLTELTSYTPAMCHADGSIRLSTGKSTLKKTQLQVEVSQHSWVFHQQLYLWFWVYLLCSGLSHKKCMEVLMHSCKPSWHKFQATTKVRHILKFWPLLTLFYEYQHQSNRWQLLELINDSSNTIVK